MPRYMLVSTCVSSSRPRLESIASCWTVTTSPACTMFWPFLYITGSTAAAAFSRSSCVAFSSMNTFSCRELSSTE